MTSHGTNGIAQQSDSWLDSASEANPYLDSHALRGAAHEDQGNAYYPDRRRGPHPVAGDRRKTPRLPMSHLSAHTVLGRKQGYVLPRPHLLKSQVAWTVLDLIMAFICGTLATVVYMGGHGPVPTFVPIAIVGLYWPLFPLVCGMLFAFGATALSRIRGLQSLKEDRKASAELLLVVQSVSLSAFGVYGALSFWGMGAVARKALPMEILLTCAMLLLCRALWRRSRDSRSQRDIAVRNIIIVDNNPVGRGVRDYLDSLPHSGYRFSGFVTGDADASTTQADNHEIIGTVHDVISLAKSRFVDEIIFSERPPTEILVKVLNQARATGIDVRVIPSLRETLTNRVDVQYIGNLPTIILHQTGDRAVPLFLKRAFDAVVGSIALVLASPFLLAIAIAVKLQSPGPAFYASERIGHKGGFFTCYKFRTMVSNAELLRAKLAHLNERNGILFKISKDPRITSIGAVLRKYSLDELPQLWNVVRGDMSLVGPRPSIRSEVVQYQTPHLRRLDVIPGMTGLWQVEARRDPSFDSYVSLDSKYVNEWSLWLDLKIIIRTVTVVLGGTGV